MLKNLNKNDEALDLLKEAMTLESNVSEKYYIPYASYELGECYFIKGDTQKAEEFFKKCSKFSGYDWEDPLKIRLR
jgi:tetratricopeptide (TPR) repeat protein